MASRPCTRLIIADSIILEHELRSILQTRFGWLRDFYLDDITHLSGPDTCAQIKNCMSFLFVICYFCYLSGPDKRFMSWPDKGD